MNPLVASFQNDLDTDDEQPEASPLSNNISNNVQPIVSSMTLELSSEEEPDPVSSPSPQIETVEAPMQNPVITSDEMQPSDDIEAPSAVENAGFSLVDQDLSVLEGDLSLGDSFTADNCLDFMTSSTDRVLDSSASQVSEMDKYKLCMCHVS